AGLGFNQSLRGYRSLALSGNDLFTFAGALAWIEPTTQDLQPVPRSTEPRRAKTTPTTEPEVSEVILSARSNPIYTGGEVGFSYGRATGKYGGEYESGYVIGEIGNDKFHLSAGASYEHFSGRVPRWGR
nr:hypothetical protein [Verrucomicrobiota bacterium]